MHLAALALIAAASRAQSQTINVFAAASLKEAFTSIASSYESSHSGTKIVLNFAGSQTLAAQINGGAPADVFASADETNLRKIEYIEQSRAIFARNRLAIVSDKNLNIHSPNDLTNADRIVVADEAVPAGSYTRTFLMKAQKRYGLPWFQRVVANIVSKEQDVKAVLTKVELGEADAGVVYVTDAQSAKNSVAVVNIPRDLNTIAEYPAAVPRNAPNPTGGQDFIRFLLTRQSQSTLAHHGFIAATKSVSLHRSEASSLALFR